MTKLSTQLDADESGLENQETAKIQCGQRSRSRGAKQAETVVPIKAD